MNKTEYQSQLIDEMNKHKSKVIEKITKLLKTLPVKANTLDIEIFPSQDGDGMFEIYASVSGPDLYVLNKAIEKYADIFSPKYKSVDVVPYIPLLDGSSVDFDVNDALVDCVAKWLKDIWQQMEKSVLEIPVSIVGHDGYGTITPIKLI